VRDFVKISSYGCMPQDNTKDTPYCRPLQNLKRLNPAIKPQIYIKYKDTLLGEEGRKKRLKINNKEVYTASLYLKLSEKTNKQKKRKGIKNYSLDNNNTFEFKRTINRAQRKEKQRGRDASKAKTNDFKQEKRKARKSTKIN